MIIKNNLKNLNTPHNLKIKYSIEDFFSLDMFNPINQKNYFNSYDLKIFKDKSFRTHVFGMGGFQRPEMAIEHFKCIADATDLPLIAFVYPVQSNLHFTFDGLIQLFDEVPTVKAIKDWCNDPKQHERHIREFQSRPHPVNVLTTHSSWLMSSLSLGAAGLLSGAGSVIAPLQVALFEAIQRDDLAGAREINDKLYPFQQAFYAEPFLDMHNRMKQLLCFKGDVPNAVVRPPLISLSSSETNRLEWLSSMRI